MPTPAAMTIGQLAHTTGVHVETIRYYQRRGLLPVPAKPLGGIRRYDAEHARRLRFIRHAQQLGFTLDEVGQLLALEDGTHCGEAQALAVHKLKDVRQKLADLKRLEAALDGLVQRCEHTDGKVCCPLIAALHEG